MKKISLGFSPCPNDTFIFDALVHQKINTRGYDFDFVIEDVEALNLLALNNQIDVTKLSFAAFAECNAAYILSNAGSALGRACGPLLITKNNYADKLNDKLRVGIPGAHTTANLLLSLAYPELTNKTELLFSDIENALLEDRIDLGLIIHENRFTYQAKGLTMIQDLGDYWERHTGKSIPLGGIALKRKLDSQIKRDLQEMIRESVEYAFMHPNSSLSWTKTLSQALNDEVIQSHIDLYVNQFSVDLGTEGQDSVMFLLEKAKESNFIEKITHPIFL